MKSSRHLRIEEVKLTPGQEWVDQTATWRFVRNAGGAAYWLDPAKPRSFTQGELLVVAPPVKAVVRASQLNDTALHGFRFAPDLLFGIFTLAERHFFQTEAALPGRLVQFLPSTHPITQRFAELGSPGAHQDLGERLEVLGLAVEFFNEGRAPYHLPPARGLSAQHRFHQIISQMPDLEILQHTPEDLARLCGCSPRHFNRLFREYFGESPRGRQTELLLLKARQLLWDTEAKVVQIALDCGYRSLGLFHSLFKRRFGLTPSELRSEAARDNGKFP